MTSSAYIFILLLSSCHIILGSASRPHVIFIVADDLGYNDIGYHARLHESEIKTPFLDQLASNGIKLENYYVQHICSPSRSQLMSGRYQIHTGLQHLVITAGQRNALPIGNKILPEQLAHCGYDTHMVGKWHLGYYKKEFMPQFRGFNSFFGYINGNEDYYTHIHNIPVPGVDMRDTYGPRNDTWGEYSTSLFTRKAREVIDRRDKSKPFFLYLSFQAVHEPMQVPARYLEPFQHIKDKTRRIYAGMVAALDEAVKNVSDHLEVTGMLDNTIFIFTTDNGGAVRFGGNNWPLRGKKATLWEGGVRGVGFVSGPRLEAKGVESQNFMHISDWLPTILKATHCPKMEGTQPLDGFDQWEAILQKQKSPRTELLHNIDPLERVDSSGSVVSGFDTAVQAGIRSGPWKLLTGNPGFDKWVRPPESLNSTSSDVPMNPSQSFVKLFHIETDPYEMHELSSMYPSIVAGLLAKLVNYNRTAVPVRYPPYDPASDPKFHGGFWGPWLD